MINLTLQTPYNLPLGGQGWVIFARAFKFFEHGKGVFEEEKIKNM